MNNLYGLRICGICKSRRAIDRHHCLFRRDKRFKKFLDVKENLEGLCHECHMRGLGDTLEHRRLFWKRQCQKYGEAHMLEWLESLPFKTKPDFLDLQNKTV